MSSNRDTIILPSGKSFYANQGLVSINVTGPPDEFELGEGYDGGVKLSMWSEEANNLIPYLSSSDLVDLANIMISRWTQFKHAVQSGNYKVEEPS